MMLALVRVTPLRLSSGTMKRARGFSLTFLCLFLLTSYALADITGKAYVTDGDTIKISGTKIRFHSIDAPETKQKCERNGQKWRCGQVATQTLRNLIQGQPVTCKGDTTDKYKRLIAVCSANGVDLNGAMVDAGMALAYRRYSKNYVSHESDAKEKGNGLWAGDFVYPWDWRRGKSLADRSRVDCAKVAHSRHHSCNKQSYIRVPAKYQWLVPGLV